MKNRSIKNLKFEDIKNVCSDYKKLAILNEAFDNVLSSGLWDEDIETELKKMEKSILDFLCKKQHEAAVMQKEFIQNEKNKK
jgi:hypothetical protein